MNFKALQQRMDWSKINNCLKHPFWMSFFYFSVVVVNLIITGDRDILATNSPYDEFWYVDSVSRMIWGGDYNHMSFAQLPVYSLWLLFLHLFGIPLRLAMSISWLISIGYLAFALRWFTDNKWIAALTFLLLAFHPYILIIFDNALAETFLTILSATVLAAGIEIWNCRKLDAGLRHVIAKWIFIIGVALAYHTRKEGIVLLIPLALLAVFSWQQRQQWWSQQGRKQLAIPLIVAPLFAVIVFGCVLASANYLKWGVFARYELASSGYTSAIAALNSIDTGRTPKHVTVTAKARLLAYEVSPTFSELRSFFEGETGKSISLFLEQTVGGVHGEIGNGWFYWNLRDAGAGAGWHINAKTADAKYRAISEELNKAFNEGRLKKRTFVISSFLDPDINKWIEYVPQSVWNLIEIVVWPKIEYLHAHPESATLKQFGKYVTILGRRNIPLSPSISGWLIAPIGTQVGFGTLEKQPLFWSPLSSTQRSDIPNGYSFTAKSAAGENATHLYVRTPDTQQDTVVLSNLHEGQITTFGKMTQIILGVDELTENKIARRLDRWLSPVTVFYNWLGYLFFVSIGISFILMLVRRKLPSAVAVVIILESTAIIVRILLLGILDASSWSGLQTRYILPVIPFFICIGLLSLYFNFNQKKRRRYENI
jgi:hypothetical protein